MKECRELFEETLWEKIFKHANYFKEPELLEVAIHEAGHSLMGEILYPGCVKGVAISAVPAFWHALDCKVTETLSNIWYRIKGENSIVYCRSGAYGATNISDDIFGENYFNRAMVAIAGYMATENIQCEDEVEPLGKTGCSSDFDIMNTCILKIRGNINGQTDKDSTVPSLGDIKLDIERQARDIIESNKEGILRLAKELVKRKRIEGKEVRRLLGLEEV